VVTRTIFELLLHFGIIKDRLPMLQFIKQPNLDYIGMRRFFYTLSLIVIITGFVFFFKKGPQAYGIDFAGGQLQEYGFKNPQEPDKIRNICKELGITDASIQQFKDNPKVVLIRTQEDKSAQLTAKFKEVFKDEDVQVLRIERVGPVAGKHLKGKALQALIWSLIGILVYVAIRFKHWNFGAAGVIAIFHDVLVALGFLAITSRPIDLLSVTAFLTIAGYSINDTIVIYDRVRENLRLNRKLNLREVINLSVNQTMSRTLLTSGVTLLVVISFMIFGGEVLSNFAFTLFVGFISGVYSTIFIASPLVLAWSKKGTR
jgi:preprotein translocase SecF subunit